jgi:hypothetical protein
MNTVGFRARAASPERDCSPNVFLILARIVRLQFGSGSSFYHLITQAFAGPAPKKYGRGAAKLGLASLRLRSLCSHDARFASW